MAEAKELASSIWVDAWSRAEGAPTRHTRKETLAERITLQEHAVSHAYEIAAAVAVWERKGILTQAEVLMEMMRRSETAGRPR